MPKTIKVVDLCMVADREYTVKREEGEKAPKAREVGTKTERRKRGRDAKMMAVFTIRVIPALNTSPASELSGEGVEGAVRAEEVEAVDTATLPAPHTPSLHGSAAVPALVVVDWMWTGCGQDVDRIWTGCGQDVDRIWTGCGQDMDWMWTGWCACYEPTVGSM